MLGRHVQLDRFRVHGPWHTFVVDFSTPGKDMSNEKKTWLFRV